jgi:hypothetical protein
VSATVEIAGERYQVCKQDFRASVKVLWLTNSKFSDNLCSVANAIKPQISRALIFLADEIL